MKLTVKEAAARASVSPSLIYSLLRQGKLAAVRIGCRGKGKWLVEDSVLDAFVSSCQSGPEEVLPPLKHLR